MVVKNIFKLLIKGVGNIILPFTPIAKKDLIKHIAANRFATHLAKKPASALKPDGYSRLERYLSKKTGIPVVEIGMVKPSEIARTVASTVAPLTKKGKLARDTILEEKKYAGWLITHGHSLTTENNNNLQQWTGKIMTHRGPKSINIKEWGESLFLRHNQPSQIDGYYGREKNMFGISSLTRGQSVFSPGQKVLFSVCDTKNPVLQAFPIEGGKTHTIGTNHYVGSTKAQIKHFRKMNILRSMAINYLQL